MRKDYTKDSLHRSDLNENPIEQFAIWFEEAVQQEVEEPHRIHLATRGEKGVNVRVVLLKDITDCGFVFYTNYQSQKAMDIAYDPNVAFSIHWPILQRQVRVNGKARKVDEQNSVDYFQSRPRLSQIAAWSSDQSKVMSDRATLDQQFQEMVQRFEGQDNIAKPDFWGGYEIEAHTMEFWQGRGSRLHDRFRYTKGLEKWHIDRLAP